MSEEIKDTKNEETAGKKGADLASDYRLIVDMVKEMEEQFKVLKDFTLSSITNLYGVKEGILEYLIPQTRDDLKEITDEQVIDILNRYSVDDVDATDYIMSQYAARQEDEEKPVSTVLREALLDIKDQSVRLYATKAETDSIRAESQEILNEYIEYASSDKVRVKRAQRLEAMKKAVAEREDGTEKRAMEKMISIMEAAQSLSFMFTRFHELGDKEVKSIVDSFFNNRKGAYVINKFKTNITRFGFSEELFKYFFNLEENFLDEYYHVYNNLFLFIYMRFIAHADPYNKADKMYVQSITSSIANLVYHKFQTNSTELGFADTIKAILDNFKDYYEKFKNENSTQPNHPHRIEADNRRNAERRIALINKMNELKITGYDENAPADELQRYLNDKLDEMIKDQTPDEESEESDNLTDEQNTTE